jgi:hypothetical protein
MPRIYTEIRITHKDQITKNHYETLLDQTIKELGYRSHAEWVTSKLREDRRVYDNRIRSRKEGK